MLSTLNITSSYKDGRTYMKDTYHTRPFRVANVGIDKSDPALYLMVMSSSPGVLDTDHYDMYMQLDANSRFQLQSQSYQRLFDMQDGASQHLKVTMGRNSVFSYVPHPVVPHENARFKGYNEIHLEDDCELTMGEIITCGRKLSGEIFKYTCFQNMTEIFHHQKLILKDNVLLQPKLVPLDTIGQVENYTHQATFIYLQTHSGIDCDGLTDTIYDMLQDEEDITFGVSNAGSHGVVLRILGNGGEQLYNCLRKVQQHLWLQPETIEKEEN